MAHQLHEAITRLQELATAFQERRRSLASAVGLTEQQWEVLEEISQEHFMPSLFARQRDSSPAAVSKLLKQLSLKGFVEASLSPDDGRQRLYELTTEGKACLVQLRKLREEAVSEVWGDFENSELGAFIGFATRLRDGVRAYQYKVTNTVTPKDANG